MLLQLLPYLLVGFVAQLIDGTLGMAYGVTSTTFLLALGVPPAAASASVHTAESVTTGISGLAHFRQGNIDKNLFLSLIIPGVIGGVTGAYILSTVPTDIIKPVIAVYLAIMGGVILWKARRQAQVRDDVPRPVMLLGLVGGFTDAIGGGGWGPVVTTTLVARGNHPRFTIGSVNTAEFFVTTAQAITFFLAIGSVLVENWHAIVGLLIGGAVAAPFGAYAAKHIPVRGLMMLVGILIILTSLRTLYLTFF